MCQLYFIGCLDLFTHSEVMPAPSTGLCCFPAAVHPLPRIYPPLRSQSMQQRHGPTSDTSYFKYSITQCAFFSLSLSLSLPDRAYRRIDSHLAKCFPVHQEDVFSYLGSAAVMNGCLAQESVAWRLIDNYPPPPPPGANAYLV